MVAALDGAGQGAVMATNQEWITRIRRQHFSTHSDAADWWDKLAPEYRGLVLHAAAVNSGASCFKSHLSRYCWRELCERLDYRAMAQLRLGISKARAVFSGFGSLKDSDFSLRTADRPLKKSVPITDSGRQMIIAPHLVSTMSKQQECN